MDIRRDITVEHTTAPIARWGALFAGLALVSATGWVLSLLGSALGFSIADTTDMEAMGQGFGIGVAIWMVLSWVAAYFVGGLLTGRLCGSPERRVGMLHGITLWSVGTIVTVVLGAWGLQSLLQAGRAVAAGAADVAGATVSAVGQGNGGGQQQGMLADLSRVVAAPVARQVEVELKRESGRVLAEAAQEGQQQQQPQQQPPGEQGQTGTAGPRVRPQEVQQALEQLDSQTLQEAAVELISGRPEGAEQVLARNTTLTEQQISAIVSGVQQRVDEEVRQLRGDLEQATETASSYMQGFLWTALVASIAALLAALAGGLLGVAERRYVRTPEVT